MPNQETELMLSVVVTVVSGKEAMRGCLQTLYRQAETLNAEIIVPYDKWSSDVASLDSEFPNVRFHFIEDLGNAASTRISAHQHRLYDRRRAVGLQLARGQIVAMTEDHARPAEDWCRQILAAHEREPSAVIGGAIENTVDKPLNWAWYYCDFGRYGRPLKRGAANYVSDVNLAYKKKSLEAVREIWHEAYRETVLHWSLRERGEQLFLDERIIVYQHRPPLKLSAAFWERVAWGRVFAETRVLTSSSGQRLMFAAGASLLPALLFVRLVKNALRQKRTLRQMLGFLPLAFLLLVGWSVGELLGYVFGLPKTTVHTSQIADELVSN